MRIEKILHQHRRDLTVVYICEHCGNKYNGSGYDDKNFHENVIPDMVCDKCGKKGDDGYRPLVTKYTDNEVI